MSKISPGDRKKLDEEIRRRGLNEYGDPKGTMYAGGTPLFDERTGATIDRYEYIVSRHRDWLPQQK